MSTAVESQEELRLTSLGAVDCDVHPRSPRRQDLMPYLDEYWRDMFTSRDIDHLDLMSNPEATAPNRRDDQVDANADAETLRDNHLDKLGLTAAVLNVVSGIHAVYDPYLATALCAATNRWLAEEWLAKDTRFRASLLVPFQHPEAAAEEIERYADDTRFVQVLTVAMGEMPLGRRLYWPIYEAAAKHGFALAIHAGSTFRHAPTQSGFSSFLVEDRIVQTQGFANQVGSLVAEGVLTKYPDLKVVLLESGVTWLPGLMWRMSKDWRGARVEIPWIKEAPSKLIREHFRMTTQPFDGPDDEAEAEKAIGHLENDEMLLFSTDFPHDHGRDLTVWPRALPSRLAGTISRDNVLSTYRRLEISS